MKFNVNSSELLKKLSVAMGAVASNPMMPILEDFKFELKNSSLTISASNLGTTIETKINVSQEEEGVAAIPAKLLTDTLKALPDQAVTIELNKEENVIFITSSYGKYNMAANNVEDFPKLPVFDNVQTFSFSTDILYNAINKTLFATSNDDLRPAMTGLYMQIENSKLVFVATDAHKLVKYVFNSVQSDISGSVILPKKTLGVIKSVISGNAEVTVSFNHDFVFFIVGDTIVSGRLITGSFPDYNAVIPINNENKMIINRLDFLNSVRRISIFANKTTNQVALKISNQELNIFTQDLDFSNQADETMPCQFEGTPITIAFNAKFLIEMLGVMDSEDVVLELSEPNRAGLLLPVDSQPDEQLTMLIMPVLLNY